MPLNGMQQLFMILFSPFGGGDDNQHERLHLPGKNRRQNDSFNSGITLRSLRKSRFEKSRQQNLGNENKAFALEEVGTYL